MALPHIPDNQEPEKNPQPVLTTVALETTQLDATPSIARARSVWMRAWHWCYLAFLKRTIDILVASVALLLIAPLLLVVAMAIRIDSPGPALYRQKRVGRGGKVFTILKFRTMRYEPAGRLQMMKAEDGTMTHKIRNDPRITRVGAWLRRTSIDELPQLLNILIGQMSLIGPRPELVEIVNRYEDWQHRRHEVRPGLTGWWQVSGRSDRPMHENTELDVFYVDHISPGLDFKILIRTIGVVTKGRGAF
ncbi:MAG TPA: sugar transferase [Thermomicrobiales bacterium]|jgi:exopolysaccharide biosynthesis polyprenyl glycosylphosphotransferase|nr:sugar transferase [Thermomicrobiales bacterium]